MAGWVRRSESPSSTQEVSAWAGNLAVQKLVQKENGELILAPVDAVVEQFRARRALLIDDTHTFLEAGSLFHYEKVFHCYESFLLRGSFRYSGKGSFGFAFDYSGRNDKNKLISISPEENKLKLMFNEGSTLITETQISLEPGKEYDFTYIQEGSAGIFYIDGMASLTVRLYGVCGNTVSVFAENNSVVFTSLRQYTKEM